MKPILFNTEMVRAILANRKTVTRRVVKPQPLWRKPPIQQKGHTEYWANWDDEKIYKSPYRLGDILYVRETFRIDYLSNIPGTGRVHYKADDTYRDFTFAPERYEMMRRAQLKPGWRPNENMPREAARIFLRGTNVSVERLRPMGFKELEEEGIDTTYGLFAAMEHFANLWDSTIKKAARSLYGWKANPWVWVIAFERVNKFCLEEDGTT